MGISGGPDMIQDGLVLSLDASDRNSYVSGSAVWRDLSGNANNGNLTNGPTFNSGNGGSIVFDATNDYVGSFPTQISGINSKTVSAFIYVNGTTRGGICGTRPLVASQGWVLTVNRTSPGNLTYFHTGGSIIELNASISINTWCQVAFTYSTVTATATLYKNGNQIGSPQTSFSTIVSSTFNGMIGNEDESALAPLNGSIANVQIYNRALSATEVLQNYNALKSRFNI